MTLQGLEGDTGTVIFFLQPWHPGASDLSEDSGHALFIMVWAPGTCFFLFLFFARLMSTTEILQRISIIKSLFIKKQVILGAENSQ